MYECPICRKKFASRRGLGTHRNHRNGDPACRYTEAERREVARLASEVKKRRAGVKKRRTFATEEERLAHEREWNRIWICRKRRRRRARIRENIARNIRRRGPPDVPLKHPLLEEAAKLVPHKTALTTLYDPLHEDLRQEAVLAILEGRDPVAAVKSYGSRERAWGRVTAPILFD